MPLFSRVRRALLCWCLLMPISLLAQLGPQQEVFPSMWGAVRSWHQDVSGDGVNDLITVSVLDDKIQWFEALQGQQFADPIVITDEFTPPFNLSYEERTVAASDFNADGSADMTYLRFNGSDVEVVVLINQNGTFTESVVDVLLGNGASSLTLFDYDNDLDPDLFVSHNQNSAATDSVHCYLNTNGNFAELFVAPVGYDPDLIEVADMNGDLLPDLVSYETTANNAAGPNRVMYYPNQGGNVFGSAVQLWSVNVTGLYFELYDVEADGDQDLIFLDYATDELQVIRHLGGGSYSSPALVTTNVRQFYRGNLNSGAAEELIVSKNGTDTVSIHGWTGFSFLQYGTGHFGFGDLGSMLGNHLSVADINGDGLGDILGLRTRPSLRWFENLGSTTFASGQLIHDFPAVSTDGMDIGDYDGDGLVEILCSAIERVNSNVQLERARIFKNSGGTFADAPQNLALTNSSQMRWVDLDQDGDLDITGFWNNSGTYPINRLLNDGSNQTFTSDTSSGVFNNPGFQRHIDWDFDGDMDMYTRLWSLDLKLNDGTGQFTTAPNTFSAFLNGGLAPMDVDGDQDMDIITTLPGNDQVLLYVNDGANNFNLSVLQSAHDQATKPIASDLDADGNSDFVYLFQQSPDYRIGVALGDGAGNFTFSDYFVSSTNAFNYTVGDFDGDQDDDIVYYADDGHLIMLQNNGGDFSVRFDFGLLDFPTYFEKIFLTDIDGDGQNDLLGHSSERNQAVWFRNTTNFTPFQLTGDVFVDLNQNQVREANEPGLSYDGVSISGMGGFQSTTFTNLNGVYEALVAGDTYTLTYSPSPGWTLTTPNSYTVTVDSLNPVADSLDFGLKADSSFTLIEPDFVSTGAACGGQEIITVLYTNLGTTQPEGYVSLTLDPGLGLVNFSPAPDSTVGSTLYWSFDSLAYFQTGFVEVTVSYPSGNAGDTLLSSAEVWITDSLGNHTLQWSGMHQQILDCTPANVSKIVTEGYAAEGWIAADQKLHYTINFQNTGTDTAQTVTVTDEFASTLNPNSFQLLLASHPVVTTLSGNVVTFEFPGIALPDSLTDPLGSKGFVRFTLDPAAGLPPGTTIENSAAVQFDLSPYQATDTTLNTVMDCDLLLNVGWSDTAACKNDTFWFWNSSSIAQTVEWWVDGALAATDTSLTWLPTWSGSHSVQVLASNPACAADTTLSVTVWDVPIITITGDSTVCDGDGANLTAGGAATYEWDGMIPGANITIFPNGQTTISVTGTDANGCTSAGSFTVNVWPLPAPVITLQNNQLQSTLPTGHQWFLDGQPVNGAIFDTLTPLANGTYQVAVTDSNGCVGWSDTLSVNFVGIAALSQDGGLLVFPNPARDQITVWWQSSSTQREVLHLHDASGRLVLQQSVAQGSNRVSLDGVGPGVYVLSVGRSVRRVVIH